MAYRAAIITLSDSGAKGLRADRSGPLIREMLTEAGFEVVIEQLLSDDAQPLTDALTDICDHRKADLVLTTGGTGFSPRDNAPEATLAAIERNVPGIAEAMRAHSLAITPYAMLSRALCMQRGRHIVINLPGSEKAARENWDGIVAALPHAAKMMAGGGH